MGGGGGRRGRGGRASPPADLPPEAAAQLQDHFDRICMNWLDENIPALGGKTPREAVATAAGRAKVLRLIRSWTDSPGPPRLVVPRDRLRRELGLADEAAEGGGG